MTASTYPNSFYPSVFRLTVFRPAYISLNSYRSPKCPLLSLIPSFPTSSLNYHDLSRFVLFNCPLCILIPAISLNFHHFVDCNAQCHNTLFFPRAISVNPNILPCISSVLSPYWAKFPSQNSHYFPKSPQFCKPLTRNPLSFVDCCLRNTPAQCVLIVVPVNVLQNWINEFDMWVPENCPEANSSRDYPIYVINDLLKTFEARATLIKKWNGTGGCMILG